MSAGLRVSAHIAPVASTKQDTIVRRGTRRDGVIALWPSVSLILDEISGQKKGEISVTAVLLAAFKIIRPGGFARLQVQVRRFRRAPRKGRPFPGGSVAHVDRADRCVPQWAVRQQGRALLLGRPVR